jgi:ATP-dependent protease ClpP protease subunit
MTTRKRRIRQEWVRNLATPQVREGVRMAAVQATAAEQAPIEADLFIYDVIDGWGGDWGVSAMDVVNLLNEFDGDVLNVRLNSPGGDFFEGVAILNALQRHSATVNVYVDGLAASAASVIAMAGDKRVMGLGAQLMVHEASTIAIGTAADMLKTAEMLEQTNDDIAALYAQCAGGEVADWRQKVAAETWFTASSAVECGLATEMAKKAEPEPEDDEDEESDESEEEESGAPPFKKKATAAFDEQGWAKRLASVCDELSAHTGDRYEVVLRAEHFNAVSVSRETPASTTPDPLPAPADEDSSASLPDAEFTPELIRSAFRKVTT